MSFDVEACQSAIWGRFASTCVCVSVIRGVQDPRISAPRRHPERSYCASAQNTSRGGSWILQNGALLGLSVRNSKRDTSVYCGHTWSHMDQIGQTLCLRAQLGQASFFGRPICLLWIPEKGEPLHYLRIWRPFMFILISRFFSFL